MTRKTPHFNRALKQSAKAIIGLCAVLFFATIHAYSQTAQENLTTKQANQLELDQVNEKLLQMKQRREALRVEIIGLDKDIGAINRALIEATKRGQELEASINHTEINLNALTKAQSQILKSLQSKRALMGEVLAALQRMGKNPPPAILVSPEDALSSVRSAILLGAVVPEIRAETGTLASELRALRETTRKIEVQKTKLTEKLNALSEDETRLTLLVEEKNSLTSRSKEDLQAEQKQAEILAKKALSLKQFIGSLETQLASATAAAKSARQADARRQTNEAKRLASAQKQLKDGVFENPSLADTTRIEPVIAFSKAKGSLLLPVSGIQLYGFGDMTNGTSKAVAGSRSKSRNIALATRPNARVRAPADSWVVYAGPFRSYGQLLILNAGEDYHMVLAGLSQVNVQSGQFVLAGEPIGRMGATRVATALPAELGSNRPVLYVEFRKDGSSIDPAPWWGPNTTTRFTAGDG
ncbi:MAG: peptidoglycan DD-metalloendopeptidase family protein [Rhizobiaceae bacterium]